MVRPLPAPPVGPLVPFLLCGLSWAQHGLPERPSGSTGSGEAGPQRHQEGRRGAPVNRTAWPTRLAHLCPVSLLHPRQASPTSRCAPLNGRTRGCVSGAYGTRSHRAPGLEVWSQEGLLPAILWHQESTWLLPGKLEIPACVSAPNSKRTQLTPILAKPFRSNVKWVKISRVGQTPQRPPHTVSLRQTSLSF